MENKEQDIDIEEDNKNIKYLNSDNKEQIYKIDFDFDILNEPLPDFTKSKKNENKFLNINNFTYKRKYNEISNNNYIINGKVIPKFS